MLNLCNVFIFKNGEKIKNVKNVINVTRILKKTQKVFLHLWNKSHPVV